MIILSRSSENEDNQQFWYYFICLFLDIQLYCVSCLLFNIVFQYAALLDTAGSILSLIMSYILIFEIAQWACMNFIKLRLLAINII